MLARLASVASVLVLVALWEGAAIAQQAPAEPPGSAAPPTTSPPPAPSSPPVAPQPAATPSTPAAPPTSGAQGTPAIVLSPEESEGIIGKSVRSAAGEDMGRIVDIIVSATNQPKAAVIDFGGFLGVGSRKIAVDWRLLQYSRTGKTWGVTSALTRNQVRVSPEYKPGEPVVVLGLPTGTAAPASPPAAQPASSPTPTPPSGQPSQQQGGGSPNPAPANSPANANPPAPIPSGQEGSPDAPRPPQ